MSLFHALKARLRAPQAVRPAPRMGFGRVRRAPSVLAVPGRVARPARLSFGRMQ